MKIKLENKQKHGHIPEWYPLDNAAKIFPAIISKRMTSLFRVSATLKKPINIKKLQLALDKMITRCPYFNVRLKAGMFWYFFEKNKNPPKLMADSKYPCMNYNIKKRKNHLFRVLPYNNRIAIEFSHGLTDGTGAMLFLKSLIAEYLEISGVFSTDKSGLLPAESIPDKTEIEDGFKVHYNKEIPPPNKTEPAFHLPEKLAPTGEYRITTGICPVKTVLKISKQHNCSLTEYLAAQFIDSYQDYYRSLSSKVKKKIGAPIILRIPINLRKMFPSKTMLNFFLAINAKIDPRLGEYTFDEIIVHVKAALNTGVDPKSIQQQIRRNVKGEMFLFAKLNPLFIKNIALKLIYMLIGDNRVTSSLSNIGKVSMPDVYANEIERFDFIPPPTFLNRINSSVLSWKDNLYFSFGNLGSERVIETIFFRKLIKAGIPVKIESNNQEVVCHIVQDAE